MDEMYPKAPPSATPARKRMSARSLFIIGITMVSALPLALLGTWTWIAYNGYENDPAPMGPINLVPAVLLVVMVVGVVLICMAEGRS